MIGRAPRAGGGRRFLFGLAVGIWLGGLPMRSMAGPANQSQADHRWHVQDLCIANSIKAHPDRTPDSLRARDAFVDACLAGNNLPPRAHMAPPLPQPTSTIESKS